MSLGVNAKVWICGMSSSDSLVEDCFETDPPESTGSPLVHARQPWTWMCARACNVVGTRPSVADSHRVSSSGVDRDICWTLHVKCLCAPGGKAERLRWHKCEKITLQVVKWYISHRTHWQRTHTRPFNSFLILRTPLVSLALPMSLALYLIPGT